jgi:hypothetical protein
MAIARLARRVRLRSMAVVLRRRASARGCLSSAPKQNTARRVKRNGLFAPPTTAGYAQRHAGRLTICSTSAHISRFRAALRHARPRE